MVCLAGFGPQALSLTQFECLAPLGSTLFINKHRLRLLQSTALPPLIAYFCRSRLHFGNGDSRGLQRFVNYGSVANKINEPCEAHVFYID